jgi:hypothetical protein
MMSWYGVNFILGQNGKSLHSYGLSTGGLGYAMGFAAFELAFVASVVCWNRRYNPVKSKRKSSVAGGTHPYQAPEPSP